MQGFQMICFIVAVAGVLSLIYQVFQIVVLDAKARGLKHPNFWGLLSINDDNGLLLYLLKRRQYSSMMTEAGKKTIESRKRKAAISLGIAVVGTIGTVFMS